MIWIIVSAEMGDLFFSFVQLDSNLFEKSSHGFLTIEHAPGFLVAFNVVFYFSLEVFVDSFVL